MDYILSGGAQKMKLDNYSHTDNTITIPTTSSNVYYWLMNWENSTLLSDWLSFKASFDASSVFLKEHPLEFVTSIKAYPFDVSSMFVTTENMGVSIGIITKNDNSGKRILRYKDYPYIDCGSIAISKKYNNFLDFYPFTKVMLYLPFIGTVELNTNQVMDKVISIKYSIDILTGKCCAFVLDDNEFVIGVYNGNMGISIPLVASDYSNIIRNLSLSAISFAMSGAFGIVSGDTSSMITNVVNAASNAGDLNNQILSNAYKAEQYAVKGYEISSSYREKGRGRLYEAMNIAPSHSKFTISESFIDWFYPHKVTAIIKRPIVKYPSSYNHEYGRPLMETATLKELEGFTVVDSVNMDGFTCTDEELSMIERLLLNGVILGEKLHVGLFDIYVNSINATYSNNSAQAESGSSYVNTFTPNEGYTLKGVEPRVVMADEAVIGAYTYDSDADTITINIPEVRGDIIIGVAAAGKEAQRFTVTNALTNVTTNADFDEINEGIPYDAVLSGEGNYSMYEADVKVMMGGVDITSTAYTPASSPTENGTIHIDSVSGNIEVYAQAEKQKTYNVTINLENAVNISGFDSDTVELYAPIDAWYTGASGYKLVTVPVIRIGGTLKNQYYTLDRSTGQIHIEIPADVIDGDVEISITATKEYSITRNFTNVAIASGSAVDEIVKGDTYSVNIKGIVGGYVITTYTVMMGGVDVTSQYAVWDKSTEIVSINIPSVTGNIVITANAEIPAPKTAFIRLNVQNARAKIFGDVVIGDPDGGFYEVEVPIGTVVGGSDALLFDVTYNGGYFTYYTCTDSSVNLSPNTNKTSIVVSKFTVNGDIEFNIVAYKPKIYTVTFKLTNIDIHEGSYDGNVIASSNGTGSKTVTMQFTEGSHGYWYFTEYRGDSEFIVTSTDQSISFAVNTESGEEWVSSSWAGVDLLDGRKTARWNSYINQNLTIEIMCFYEFI